MLFSLSMIVRLRACILEKNNNNIKNRDIMHQLLRLVSEINSRLLSVNHALMSPFSDSPSFINGTSSIGSIDSPLASFITAHSFIPGFKPAFSAKPSHRNLPFLLWD